MTVLTPYPQVVRPTNAHPRATAHQPGELIVPTHSVIKYPTEIQFRSWPLDGVIAASYDGPKRIQYGLR